MIMCHLIKLKTNKGFGIQDLTEKVRKIIEKSGIRNGYVIIFTKHTTTGLSVCEKETRLIEDTKRFLERLAPKNDKYLHDDVHLRDCPPDERQNGHSHIKALILNRSEVIPIANGEMMLGTWQSIILFELDGSREREVVVQVGGDK